MYGIKVKKKKKLFILIWGIRIADEYNDVAAIVIVVTHVAAAAVSVAIVMRVGV